MLASSFKPFFSTLIPSNAALRHPSDAILAELTTLAAGIVEQTQRDRLAHRVVTAAPVCWLGLTFDPGM